MTMRTITNFTNDRAQAEPSGISDRSPETERTVYTGRLCAGCSTELTGRRRQARFCSDDCRTKQRRGERAGRIAALVEALEQTLATLKAEMGHE
jgi:hypothetical protein